MRHLTNMRACQKSGVFLGLNIKLNYWQSWMQFAAASIAVYHSKPHVSCSCYSCYCFQTLSNSHSHPRASKEKFTRTKNFDWRLPIKFAIQTPKNLIHPQIDNIKTDAKQHERENRRTDNAPYTGEE